jgi:hypothetical protein
MVRLTWRVVVAACMVVIAAPNAFAEKRVALVIGNSAYKHSPALKNAKHDAVDIAAALKGLGFRVIEGHDLKKAAMDTTIRDFAVALADANVGLFFYAGHGLQVSGENYLVPIDAKLDSPAALEFEMVRLQTIQRVMERATETNVLFLDACRDNPLARNLARALGTRSASIGRGLAPAESGVGTLISFSTQPGNVALDGTGRNSPFADALVQDLASSSEDLSTILINVRNKVMAETGNRQVPWEHSALRARFYLHNAPPAGATTTGPQPVFSEAAQAWAVTKDSTSTAVLRTFSDRYPGTVYAELARARLKEMEDEATQRATWSDPAPFSSPSAGPFDGVWEVAFSGGAGCGARSGTYLAEIIDGQFAAPRSGSVSPSGDFSYTSPTKRKSNFTARWTGKLSGDSGNGKYLVEGRPCAGTIVLKRQASQASLRQAEMAATASSPRQPFDGIWLATWKGNQACPMKGGEWRLTVHGTVVQHPSGSVGSVNAKGELTIDLPAKVDARVKVRHTIELSKNSGTGTFQAIGAACAGTTVLKRSSEPMAAATPK